MPSTYIIACYRYPIYILSCLGCMVIPTYPLSDIAQLEKIDESNRSIRKIQNKDGMILCSVCLDTMVNGNNAFRCLYCHTYIGHERCVKNWFTYQTSCPHCGVMP
jgi:hypothetical protein